MPIYEYECKGCGHRFELRRGIADRDSEVTCPECGGAHPKRVICTFGTLLGGGGCAPTGGGATIGGG